MTSENFPPSGTLGAILYSKKLTREKTFAGSEHFTEFCVMLN